MGNPRAAVIMQSSDKTWKSFAGFSGFTAIVMGAVAAHALSGGYPVALAEKASLYQLIHAAMLYVLATSNGKYAWLSRWLFLAGTILFCGGLYLKAVTGWASAASLAPMGGLSFMLGWLAIGMENIRK